MLSTLYFRFHRYVLIQSAAKYFRPNSFHTARTICIQQVSQNCIKTDPEVFALIKKSYLIHSSLQEQKDLFGLDGLHFTSYFIQPQIASTETELLSNLSLVTSSLPHFFVLLVILRKSWLLIHLLKGVYPAIPEAKNRLPQEQLKNQVCMVKDEQFHIAKINQYLSNKNIYFFVPKSKALKNRTALILLQGGDHTAT